MVNHPPHYTSDSSGVECIEITRKMGFSDGNCFKYLYRAGSKSNTLEDLKKALWYAEDYKKNLNPFVNLWRTWRTHKLIKKVAEARYKNSKGSVALIMEMIAEGKWERVAIRLESLIRNIEFDIGLVGYSPKVRLLECP